MLLDWLLLLPWISEKSHRTRPVVLTYNKKLTQKQPRKTKSKLSQNESVPGLVSLIFSFLSKFTSSNNCFLLEEQIPILPLLSVDVPGLLVLIFLLLISKLSSSKAALPLLSTTWCSSCPPAKSKIHSFMIEKNQQSNLKVPIYPEQIIK